MPGEEYWDARRRRMIRNRLDQRAAFRYRPVVDVQLPPMEDDRADVEEAPAEEARGEDGSEPGPSEAQ